MSNKQIISREDSLKERALQILNLRYLIESDIKSSYRRRIIEYHPDKHLEAKDDPKRLKDYENKLKVLNQAYELLLDLLKKAKINRINYPLLEKTELVQTILPENVRPVSLGKTEIEIWKERYENII